MSAAAAAQMRDLFIPYVSEHWRQLGITADTEWVGTIVKPRYLVVTHYLFFSDQWELGVMWHNTIPPYNWAEVYLRRRFLCDHPQYAFRISSVTADPPEEPHVVPPPEPVDR